MPRRLADAAVPNRPTASWTRRSLLGAGVATAGVATLGGRLGASSPPDEPAATTGDAAAPTSGDTTATSGATAPADGGFATATDAIGAYLTALAGADFDAAQATFAVDPYVDGFDFSAYLRWLRHYQFTNALLPLPNTDPFNAAVNRAHRRSRVASEITNQYFALAHPELDRTASGQLLRDDAEVDEFVDDLTAAMTPASLGGLASWEPVPIEELDPEAVEMLASDESVEHHDRLVAMIGADEAQEIAVRTALDAPLVLLFRAVRYGDRWWLETLTGQLATLLGVPFLAAGVLYLAADAPAPPSTDAGASVTSTAG